MGVRNPFSSKTSGSVIVGSRDLSRDCAMAVLEERERQKRAVDKGGEGRPPVVDNYSHTAGELGSAAACYLMAPSSRPYFLGGLWPWLAVQWKSGAVEKFEPNPGTPAEVEAAELDGRIVELIKGNALGLAELERVVRLRERLS